MNKKHNDIDIIYKNIAKHSPELMMNTNLEIIREFNRNEFYLGEDAYFQSGKITVHGQEFECHAD